MAQMYWYTTLRNTINKIEIPKEMAGSIVVGNEEVCQSIYDIIMDHYRKNKNPCVIAMDGYLGSDWSFIVDALIGHLKRDGLEVKIIDFTDLYKDREWIEKVIATYTDTDPSLGTACTDKRIEDLLSPSKIGSTRTAILHLKKKHPPKLSAILCHGIGSASKPLRAVYNRIYFYDLSRVSVMMKKFANKLREPYLRDAEPLYWKREMYFYYHILDKYRKDIISHMDGYIDGNDDEKLKLIPIETYNTITYELSRIPLKFRRFMQPGNWGGLHHKSYFNLPELTNCAWDTMFYAPKNSCIFDVGIGSSLEIPFLNVQLQYPEQVVGPYLAGKYSGLLPMIACIDDGYFPKPVKPERSNMPVHLHPDGVYVKKNFNERLGRYETYYIVEAYENANTMLGLLQDADIDKFRQKIIDAEQKQIKFDWQQYVKTWPSKAGDLYLIPAGTIHGTGGHQMILEMDTCPSNVGTEYSFFIYDFLRPSWDDDKKEFSAPPVKLQTKHGIAQARWYRREKWVEKNLLAKPHIIREGKGWSEEQYDSYGPMPFHIERMNFDKKIYSDTLGRFCHLVCLTKGDRAMIRSKREPERKVELEWIQFALIPAGFGEYECINTGKSSSCSIVRERWKRG